MAYNLKKTLMVSAIALCVLPVTAQAKPMAGKLDVSVTARSFVYQVATDAQGQKAKEFIDSLGANAVSFLGNTSLSKTQKEKEFRKLLKSSFDMPTIGRFAMGRHWRTATPAQQKEYLNLFENMIVNVYSSRFGEYNGEKFDVSGFRDDGKKDILVSSYIVPNGGSKVKVDWRVREKNGKMKIIDVIIEGVSMSLTQRSDFSSVIQRGGGKVEVLLDHLRK